MILPDLPTGYAWRLCGTVDGGITEAFATWTGRYSRYGLGRIHRTPDGWRALVNDSGGMPMWHADHADPYTAWQSAAWAVRHRWSKRRPATRYERTFDTDHSRPATVAHHLTGRRIGARHAEHARTCTEPTCGLTARPKENAPC